jgi:hypothetical protein
MLKDKRISCAKPDIKKEVAIHKTSASNEILGKRRGGQPTIPRQKVSQGARRQKKQ